MVDGVTAEVDKVTAVYELEEICDLLGASDAIIVKEILLISKSSLVVPFD
jgi:hypothetical protein